MRAKFGGYNVDFYKKVFELLLRLKANFLWPAMWPGYPNPGASFFTDDPENQRTADAWGIVVSTSHHEPMQRMSNEWLAEDNPLGTWDWLTNKERITAFFRKGAERAKGYDSYFTMGMRGEYDTKMRAADPAAVVSDVLRTQRALIKDVYGREDAVPQLLAIYKEVQQQYESGRLEVPDDVTLLFADDNFGTIRRLPRNHAERERRGGAGIYYHFEYVGTPRSYKWINSNSLGKTWHQLQEAHRRGARQIWVFNVGDIKPLEVPLTFAMALAWDINSVSVDGLPNFLTNLAVRDSGEDLGADVAKAWHEYDRLVSLRRHEHVEPTTFSLLHYHEAETLLNRWKTLQAFAEAIHTRAPETHQPAIFQLVLHPVKATTIFLSVHLAIAQNQLYARQRRTSTNLYAQRALSLFEADFDVQEAYHALLGGKWNGILAQPHYGFIADTWHAPNRDMLSGLCFVQSRQASNAIMGNVGVMVEGHEGVRPGVVNENSDFMRPSRGDLGAGLTLGAMTRYGPVKRWFEVFSRGNMVVHWRARVLDVDWVRLSRSEGILVPGEEDERVWIEIIWDDVPVSWNEEVTIDLTSQEGDLEHVHLPVLGRRVPQGSNGTFVEGDGVVCIPPTRCRVLDTTAYQILPDTGRFEQGAVALNPMATSEATPEWLEYKLYTFTKPESPTGQANLALYFNMTLDVDPDDAMMYEFSIDDGPIQQYRLLDVDGSESDPELPSPGEWLTAVQDCAWRKVHDMKDTLRPDGEHVLRLRLLHPNVILERIVVDLGGLKESYLGPPPSFYVE